jgi:thiamine-phosphate pyrophosphorylase
MTLPSSNPSSPTPRRPEGAGTLEEGGDPQGAAGAWRALDASANRAAEALRVIEDVLRFVLDDAHLTAVAKRLRHDLGDVLATEPLPARISLRDVAGDVGPGVGPVGALPRRSPADLVAANGARAAQALRSLQECALLLRPPLAPRFEALRYRVYDLERAALVLARASDRLAGITLCVLVDGGEDARRFGTLVEGLLDAGVRMIQVRDKSLAVPALVGRVRLAVELARRRSAADALIIVNDRPDVVVAVGAGGVHLGSDDLPLDLVRRVTGPTAVVGCTAHDIDEALAAVRGGADYLGVGPCFPSSTKSFGSHAGKEFLTEVAATIALPAFAIGGVTLDRLDDLRALGWQRVAVAAAITSAADPAAMAALFLERLQPPGAGVIPEAHPGELP